MNLAIIGCGLIGKKRANNIGDHRITWVADVQRERAESLAGEFDSAKATSDWTQAVTADNVGAVIIATTHDQLVPVGLKAAEAGKHILVEKPGARSAKEIQKLIDEVKKKGVIAKVGFNHRYHPAFLKAREIFDSGDLGPLMFIRARYGHGGRLGYEKEWRADPEISGGGEFIDQGMHLVDLSRWFLGDFKEVSGYTPTYFWDMDVEDNCFLSLKTSVGQMAWLHASWTEWKNLFCFEIYGKFGKLKIDGLGGSYGVETLAYYKMLPDMKPPITSNWEYTAPDNSWALEFEEFVAAIKENRSPVGNLEDARAALEIMDKLSMEYRN